MKREGMLLRALSVMGAISLGAGFSACDDSDTGTTDTGVECTSNDDCEAGEICNEDNICVEETTDAECGNGVVETDEVCDDGEDNGTPGFCSDDCSEVLDEEAVCGDGEVEGDEVCDDGEDNGTPGFCNSNCDGTVPADCGDGTVQEGEECDDGNDVDTDACTNECTNAVCGDGIIQDGVETCDDGEDNGTPNNCNATCDGTTAAVCGNEVVEADEDCDSGGVQTADCEADCTSPTCGDGVLNEDAGETCDDGEDNGTPNNCNNSCDGTTSASCGNGTIESGEDCDDAGESATCNADCSAASCGDGIVNATAGETCDDGNDNGTPNNCNATCDGTTAAVCGNSVVEAGEDCDTGGQSATCEADCSEPLCGDGIVNGDAGETCDDGTDNGTPNNCNATCDGTTAAVCGNGILEGDETCDDGTDNGTPNNCNATCDGTTAAVCGNSVVEAGEDCDDGGNSASCDNDCTAAVCGDELVNPAAGESCDDGDLNGEPNQCNSSCNGQTGAVCGNGAVEAGEDCDDGGESATCDANCSAATCGDGTVNATAGETCDDGTDNGTPNNCNTTCDGTTAAVCGNDVVEAGETCDDGADNGTPNNCNSSCDGTTAAVCGNSVIESGETCDDGGESASCNSDCTAASCGDGVTNTTAGEQCDDAGESASCNADCTTVSCGDGIVNSAAGETCDDGSDNGTPNNCNSTCDGTTAAVCGNSVVESGEDCDDGGESATCNSDCSAATCGDGVTNATAGEQCDDAGESASCDADCTNATCGDETVNSSAGETCDDGSDNGTPNNCNSTCDGTTPAVCGNSVVESGEDCDTGGQSATCEADCSAPVCGDGTLNELAGEECDDGNTTSGDGCEADCSLPAPTGFRLNTLVLRDPHIFVDVPFLGCNDVTNDGVAGELPGGINGLIDEAIQEEDPDNAGFYGLSFLVSLLPLDQTGGSMDGTVEFPECTFADPSTCTRDTTQPVVMADVTSQTSGQCLGVLSGTTNYTPAPTTTSAGANGCFVSEEVTVTVSIADIPITLQNARVAARYDGDPASGLVNGLLRGFLTEADADGIALPSDLPLIGGDPLSSVLPGGGACGGGDARDSLGGVSGWWFYLNFTAESVTFVIP